MAFVLGYDSENKWIRYGSYIALGCATGVKIFPALLAILILRKKEWKEFLICFVVVTALLLAPFVFTDGNIGMLLTTIMSYSSTVAASNGVLNFSDISSYLGLPGIAGTAVSLGVTALCIITVLFRKDVPLWKLLGMLCSALALCFSIGSEYLLVYMIIPLLFFLRDEHEPTGLNLFYVILLAVIFMLMPAFGPTDYRMIGTIKAVAALVFMITLYADSFGLIGMKHRRSDDGLV